MSSLDSAAPPTRLTRSKSRSLARTTKLIRRAGEVVLMVLVAGSPWLLAGAEPAFEAVIAAGVALLVSLWAIHASLARQVHLHFDILTLPLAGLALVAALQLVPLPQWVVGVVSPQRLAWHRELIPATLERSPGEVGPAPARPDWLPMTVAPGRTWLFLARVSGLLLVGLVVRNWLATREAFEQVALVMTANGVALAFLSVAAFFGGTPDRVLWLFLGDSGTAFGPFVCRNHYPDYAAVALGFALGLLMARRERRTGGESAPWLTPLRLALLVGVGMMAVAVPFSLSRGGTVAVAGAAVLAWLLSRLPGGGAGADSTERSPARFLVVAALSIGLLVLMWLGSGAVEARLGTLAEAQSLSSRLPLWRDALKLAPAVWPVGTGAGTFVTAEPTVRGPETPAMFFADHAHNDYLEALIEGGVVRLAMTLVLAVGVVVAVGRGYLARRDRSVGPRLLGLFFALCAVALHAGGDFALHMPAVAIAAVTAAAFALAAAAEERFVPGRVQVRRSTVDGIRTVLGEVPPAAPERSPSLTGRWAGLAACGLVVVAGAGALELRAAARTEKARAVADRFPVGSMARADVLAAAADARPGDAVVLYDAGQAYLDAAAAATPARQPRFSQRAVTGPVRSATDYFVRARAADPLLARVHGRLGVVAPYLASGDPAATYLDRAKRLQPADAETWFAAGREALSRGDLAGTLADWRYAAAISEPHQKRVLDALSGKVAPGTLLSELVPNDAARLLAAADTLYAADPAGRRGTLGLVVRAAEARGAAATADDRLAQALAAAELGSHDQAEAAWAAAVALAPGRADIRDRYAQWLDARERYPEAVEQLEWLRGRIPNAYALRYKAALRGAQLLREIAEP